ncbi:uncharacterized protein LOC115227992 [Octopus sinensis]|uniref:Uncharacterized protein LOC115227992 n=1 Tax=Octopus sinensis TaxID=2607531 RepID=A0A6P7TRZ2_9MOLL|nr:uncharacterized protein LOC115227992 [Octopus sinensis]
MKRLSLSGRAIGCLGDFASLGQIEHLSELDLSENSICSWSDNIPQRIRRDWCISYLPSLRVLNRTRVSDQDRENAERAFIRHYTQRHDKPERFYELREIHGDLGPLLDVDLTPPKVVSLRLFCDGFCSKTVPVSVKMSVTELRKLICRELFDNKRNIKFKMFHDNHVGGPEELKYPNKLLYSLRICDEDTILVVTLN